MSEQIQTPKKKRRTGAEIEASRAAGEDSSKGNNKRVKEIPKDEEQAINAPEDKVVKTTQLSPEKSVLIMACLEPEVSKAAIDAAKEKGLEVVLLENRVILDYLNTKERKETKSIQDFLNNTSNRLHAEEQVVQLWTILTGGASIENSDERIFTETEVVKKTTLTHSKAKQIFQMFRAFGMLEFTKGTHEFILHINKNRRSQTIKTEVVAMCKAINNDILRYKSSIDNDDSLTSEQRNELYQQLQKTINETIEY